MKTLRLLVVGTATAATLLLNAPPAMAASDTTAARAAAGYLVSQLAGGDHLTSELGDESITADAVLALVAAGRNEDAPVIEAMTGYLASHAPAYAAAAPESAAKLALTVQATGGDPSSFGGQDLLAMVRNGIQPDGSFGAYPGPYASGLALIVLSRAGQEIPQPLVDKLVSTAAPDGGWGYDPTQPADADNTGMALLGLAALPQPGEAAAKAIDSATTWATSSRSSNGSWAGYAPVNSTAVLGTALQSRGTEQPEAVAYLVSQQQSDGGLASGAEGAAGSDLLATAQGALLLAGSDYLTVKPIAAAPGLDAATVTAWIAVAAVVVAGGVTTTVLVRKRRR